jgi:hypothetical protein
MRIRRGVPFFNSCHLAASLFYQRGRFLLSRDGATDILYCSTLSNLIHGGAPVLVAPPTLATDSPLRAFRLVGGQASNSRTSACGVRASGAARVARRSSPCILDLRAGSSVNYLPRQRLTLLKCPSKTPTPEADTFSCPTREEVGRFPAGYLLSFLH